MFNFFKRFKKRKDIPKPETKIEGFDYQTETVVICSREYKQISGNLIDYPCERALTAYTIFQEYDQRATMEFIEETTKATLAAINKGDLVRASVLQTALQERFELTLVPAELIYKLASIIYIAPEESMYVYDFDFNAEKIRFWKSQTKEDFFLCQPISKYLPDLALLGIDLDTFLKGGNLQYLKQWESVIKTLSDSVKLKDVKISSMQQIENLLNYSHSESSLFTTIMNYMNQYNNETSHSKQT